MRNAIFRALVVFSLSFSAEASPRSQKIQELTQSSLAYLSAIQVKKADGVYVPGEWTAQVYSSTIPVMVGVGSFKPDQEPSAFTTGSIINHLATMYRDNPKLAQIPPMIEKAIPTLERFREGDRYNFYPPKMWRGVRVHQAATMSLAPYWKGFTNIPEDADTTSVSYTARYYFNAIRGMGFEVPTSVTKSLSTYRDLNRDPHSYNAGQRLYNTGAFLTWQYDENDPRMPRFYFAEPEQGKRMPFNKNDIDCIVNLNVLRMLALTGNSHIKGRAQSCGVAAYIIQSRQYAKCGMYYPNTYNFPYSAASMDKAGEKCLRPYSKQMIDFILDTRAADGGWYNIDNTHVEDRIQSTAFAVIALTQFGDRDDHRVRSAVDGGMNYLLRRVRKTKNGLYYWPGEIFFTATALARSLVNWKSNAFTTVVSMDALISGDRFLSEDRDRK